MPKGMILAAGLGERLRPLTEWLPKPLLPVANQPVMLQGVRRLQAAGVTEICANLSYKPSEIRQAFGDGSAWGVRLQWTQESELLGTAGGMKNAQHLLQDDVIVLIAGDAMLDIDLTPLIEKHRSTKAIATIGTLRVEDCSQYGVVVTRDDGRILRFQEKPKPGTEISKQANTGIYIFSHAVLELIPDGVFFDFAHDVFPQLLERDMPFYAFEVNGYWTDIGNPRAYLQANLDYLGRRAKIEGRGESVDGNLIGEGARVDGARLTRCVVGSKASIPAGSELTDCVVWAGTTLPEPAELSRAILTPFGLHAVNQA